MLTIAPYTRVLFERHIDNPITQVRDMSGSLSSAEVPSDEKRST